MEKDNYKLIARNPKAYHDYEIIETLEAGVELLGVEVKSLRVNGVSIKEGYVVCENNEVFLINVLIKEYSLLNGKKVNEARKRKLLLHRKQINKVLASVQKKGYTTVPLKMYFNARGLVKLEIGVAKGKNSIDKRQSIKEKDLQREQSKELKNYKVRL